MVSGEAGVFFFLNTGVGKSAASISTAIITPRCTSTTLPSTNCITGERRRDAAAAARPMTVAAP